MNKDFAVFLLIFLFFPFITADIISLNSGGTGNVIMESSANIEGFFFCVPTTCTKLGYNCGSWSDNCAGTLNCGSCSSGYTCSSGTCTAVPSGGGGAGGGAGAGGAVSAVDIDVNPKQISVTLAINTNKEETIRVTNLGTSKLSVSVSQSNLNNMVIFKETSLVLASKETKELHVVFVALSQPGVYAGKIIIGGKEVLVLMNVKTELLLFDSNIVVLNKDYKVAQGDKLKTKVTLIPMGDQARTDVTLKYAIKDYDGKVYLTQSETVLVEKQIDFKRNFNTGMLHLGNYVVALELIYPGGVAPSSAHFEVVERASADLFVKIIFYLVSAILIVAILIILLLIRRRRRS